MTLEERLAARRGNQLSGRENEAPKQSAPTQEAKGQVINSQRLNEEQEYQQRWDSFKSANGRYPKANSNELDTWHSQNQQQTKDKQEQHIGVDDRKWEAAARKEAQAPTLKSDKPIEIPNSKDALDRVASQRQDQVKQMDMDPNVKKHQLSR